ncbi:MAG: hypothetical protein R6V32_04620 [Bacteroidales bacterium]
MIRIIYFIAFILGFINPFYAQFYTELNTGYAYPVDHSRSSNLILHDSEKYYDNNENLIDMEINNKYIKVSKGLFISNESGLKFCKNFGFSLKTYYLNNSIYKESSCFVKNKKYYLDSNNNIKEHNQIRKDLTSSQLSFTPKLSFSLSYKKFTNELSVGYVLSFIKIYEQSSTIGTGKIPDINDSLHYNIDINKEYLFPLQHSIFIENSFLYNINKKFDISLSCSFSPLLRIQPNKTIQTYYYEHQYNENPTDEYWIDKEVENKENKEISTNKHLYFDYSNLSISIGLRYYFGTTKNNGNDE